MPKWEYSEIQVGKGNKITFATSNLFLQAVLYTPEGKQPISQSEQFGQNDFDKAYEQLQILIAKMGLAGWEVIDIHEGFANQENAVNVARFKRNIREF